MPCAICDISLVAICLDEGENEQVARRPVSPNGLLLLEALECLGDIPNRLVSNDSVVSDDSSGGVSKLGSG